MHDHVPVMLEEVIAYLDLRPNSIVVDCTTGLGGHAAAIAARLTGGGRLIARDRDTESLGIARQRLKEFEDRVTFDPGRFSELHESLVRLGIPAADRVLVDCGLSMYQLKTAQRGFSFQEEGLLDMRMGRNEEGPSAGEIVNFYSERDIAQILEAGEERRARRIARAIVRARPVGTTIELSGIVRQALPSMDRGGRIPPRHRKIIPFHGPIRRHGNGRERHPARREEHGVKLLSPGQCPSGSDGRRALDHESSRRGRRVSRNCGRTA